MLLLMASVKMASHSPHEIVSPTLTPKLKRRLSRKVGFLREHPSEPGGLHVTGHLGAVKSQTSTRAVTDTGLEMKET